MQDKADELYSERIYIQSSKFSSSIFSPKMAWNVILGFYLLSLICAFAGLGKILNLIFPFGAFLISFSLYFRYPILYLGFNWWLWFLTPLIRRLADYYGGSFTNPSPILLAPFLAASVIFITLCQSSPKIHQKGGLPFVLSLTGVSYAFVVGLVRGSPSASIIGFLDSAIPILMGFHLFSNWKHYSVYRQHIQRVFTWGAFVAGSYSIYQYVVAPPWDRFWLVGLYGSDARLLGTSFGTPEPLGIRVWGTMNGPLDFSVTIMVALLILLSYNTPLRLPASSFGYLSFLLSQARTAWGGALLCLFLMFFSSKPSLQIRLIITISMIALFVIPLVFVEPFSEIIGSRFETLSNLEEDGSGNARSETYRALLIPALKNFIGYGIGNTPDFGHILDSSILVTLFDFGWIGSFFYFAGFFLLLISLLQSRVSRFDAFAGVCRAVALSSVWMMFLGPVMLGVTGCVIWSFLSIGVASVQFYKSSN